MVYLVLTILLNAIIFSIFKLFPKYKIDALQAIVVNYITCVATGSIFIGEFPISAKSFSQQWLPWAVLMGAMFISLFNLIAWRTKEDGMTTTTVANKLSLVIPVLFSFFLYNESINGIKIIGIVLAFPAVYFTTRINSENKTVKNILFPALLFLGSGLLDTLVKFVQYNFLENAASQARYTVHVFAAASILGCLIIISLKIKNKIDLHARNIIAGIILGVPNYFSIYFLIRLLNDNFLQSSAAIPVNNIGILVVSSLAAILFFKEKASGYRILGLALSIASILLIALADIYGR